MGCVSSTTYTNPRRTRPPLDILGAEDLDENENPPPPPQYTQEQLLQIEISKIVDSLATLKCPDGLVPVVCLNENSFPVYLANFLFDEQNETNLFLPVIAISHIEKRKFMFFGSVTILMHSYLTSTEISAFIENAISWGADYRLSSIRIFLYQMPKSMINNLKSDLSGYGYSVEAGESAPDTKHHFDVVFTTTANRDIQKILEFSESGSAIFYFYMEPYTQLHPLLSDIGLSFARCELQCQAKVINTLPFQDLQSYTAKQMTEDYKKLLASTEEIDQEKLDNIVSKLRYYVSEMTRRFNTEELIDIENATFDYLERTNFRNNDEICTDIRHCMVSILLTEIIQKIPPNMMKPAPALDLFPGPCTDEVVTKQMKIHLQQGVWFSTGLWLPAGQIAIVKSSAKITVQVGSHSLCLLVKPGPWHRWPSVVNLYSLEINQTGEISTQFGGPVFLIAERDKPLDILFQGFCEYPLYSVDDTESWERTKNSSIQWGEIETKYLYLNLRTEDIKKLPNIQKFCDDIDKLIESIHQFEGISNDCKSRVVFDVDLPFDNEPVIEDVVYLHISMVDDCLNPTVMTDNLALFLLSIAQSLILDVFLDTVIERAIAICAVRYSVLTNLPEAFFPNCIDKEAPKLFTSLWSIFQQYGLEPFGIALRQLSIENIENEETAWRNFIAHISEAANADLERILDHGTKPGSLAVVSSERLHQFQLDDVQI